jgi:hypothetical protein
MVATARELNQEPGPGGIQTFVSGPYTKSRMRNPSGLTSGLVASIPE